MTKTRNGLIALLLVVGGIWAVSRFSDPNRDKTMTREDCQKLRDRSQELSTKKMRIRLNGKWGGGHPATISYSIDQSVVDRGDVPGPDWQEFIYVRVCELIILHVTPTKGEGLTTCGINRANATGRGTHSENPEGGPVQCIEWYQSLD